MDIFTGLVFYAPKPLLPCAIPQVMLIVSDGPNAKGEKPHRKVYVCGVPCTARGYFLAISNYVPSLSI
ncbi:hypothetical protein AB1N83_007585 [Pleurotus pulmonarius]